MFHQKSPTRLVTLLLFILISTSDILSVRWLYTFLTRQIFPVQAHHSELVVHFHPATILTPLRIVRNYTLVDIVLLTLPYISLWSVFWYQHLNIAYQKGSGSNLKRRQALVGVGTLLATSVPATLLLAEGNLPKLTSLLHSFGTKSITLFGLVMFLQRYRKATQLLWIKKTDILIITHQTGGWVSYGFGSSYCKDNILNE